MTPPRQHWKRWALPGLLAAIVFVAFLPVLRAEFVSWDDNANFLANPNYRGFTVPHLKWMWTTILLGHYVPLSWMSLAFDYTVWGMNPAGYHLTNLVLHVANTVLLYLVGVRLLRAAGVEDAKVMFAAACGALFFGLHPLRTESVAWITERRDVLSLLWYLASVWLYLEWAESRQKRWYGLALVAFLCAILSKATSVTLPVALLIVNVFPLGRLGGAAGWRSRAVGTVYRELIPFAVLAAAAAMLSVRVLQPGAQLPWGDKLAVTLYSLAFYLVKTVLPIGLSPLYEMPVLVKPAEPMFLASYGLVVALCVAVWAVRRQRPGIAAASVAFVALIFPLLGVVQNGPQIAADRYTYQAATALSMLVAALVLALPRAGRVALATAVVAGLGVLTWRQTAVWHDSFSLWSRVVQVDSASAIGNNNLGVVIAESGQGAAAINYYRQALRSRPNYADALNNLGYELAALGRTDEALQEYDKALAVKPDYLDARINRGNALLRQERLHEAVEEYEAAAAIRPDIGGLQYDWGVALLKLGKFPEAVQHLTWAVELEPDLEEAHEALAEAREGLDSAPPRR